MKKIALFVPSLLLMSLPLAASAHEMATYKIGGQMYQIVIGSLNEPIVVDDRTGVDLTVSKCSTPTCAATMSPDGGMDGPAGAAVTGLDQTLKLELVAGDHKKMVTMVPQDTDGKYTAPFYPTVATTFAYHLTGTIATIPVDLTYTCIPEGTPNAPLNSTPVQLSNGVTQMSTSGGFGCPQPKSDFGFPQTGVSIGDLAASAGSAKSTAQAALAIGVVGLVFAVWAIRRKNS